MPGRVYNGRAQRSARFRHAALVLLGSVGLFALFLFVIRRWTASAYAFAPFPLVALSALLEGERLTLGLLAGEALVLAGVYLGALRPLSPRPQREAAAAGVRR